MILGEFNERGELIFEVGLVASDGDIVPIQAVLDTGFTGWLAIDVQDAESLGWNLSGKKDMQSAEGEAEFKVYSGNVLIDSEEFNIEILGGESLKSRHCWSEV